MKLFSKIRQLFKRTKVSAQAGSPVKSSVVKNSKKQSSGRIKNVLSIAILGLFCFTILGLSLRGMAGNPTPTQLNSEAWKDNGPLELSPERGRYALLYSLTEYNTFTFNKQIAAFAAPDVGYTDNKYVSLFAPGVSYMAIPGYLAGKAVGLAQVGTFAVISVFAVLNFFLIRAIAIRLGANKTAAAIGGLAFLFASPAFAYAVTLYQHHISTFLILASIYLLIRYNSVLSLAAIWILCGVSIAVDYPNFFMMLPIGLFALGRTFPIQRKAEIIKISMPLLRVFAIGAIVIPLGFFLWFNNASYGSPFTLSGSVERAIEVKPDGKPVMESEVLKKQLEDSGHKNVQVEDKSVGAFFNPRNMINGFYSHFLSFDRGMILYTPVMLLGIAGLILFKSNKKYLALFTAVVGFNVVTYSMWGDPYGGWAFGSRYLIPTYAVLAIFIATLITKWNRNIIFLILFFLMFSYSVGVNTLGAITSNRNPPQVEILGLEKLSGKKEEYTYTRNMQMLDAGVSKSFVYQTYVQPYMSAWNYYAVLTGSIVAFSGALLVYEIIKNLNLKSSVNRAEVKSHVVVRRKEVYAI